MAQDIPETYKKYVIQRIINPGVYWMSKNHNAELYKKEMQQLNNLLAKSVEKIVNTKNISIGKVIAVEDEAGFHRGVVIDIFNRNKRIIYSILLIDHGNITETNEEKIYWIRNKELINRKKAIGVKVSIKGIQPASLDIKYDKCFSKGIFEKRVQDNWSPCAFKFVQDIFKKNPCVFVKPVHSNNSNISGEIYFMPESENALVSLGQKLCDNGFAIFSEINSRAFDKMNFQGDSDLDIEKKIPSGALSERLQNKDILKHVSELNKDRVGRTLTVSVELTNSDTDIHFQQNKVLMDSDKRKSSFSNSLMLNSDTDSSSRIIKECPNSFNSSYTVKKHAFPESKETSSSFISDDNKIGIFRVVQRSLDLYEKEKKILKGYCQN